MKANENDKNNHRSPFTGILWPSGNKVYINPRYMDIERDLNSFLSKYRRIYYRNGIVSGYVKELKEKDVTINIGGMGEVQESTANFEMIASYKHCFSAIITQMENQKNTSSVSLKQTALLTYNISFSFPKIKESTSFSGQLTSNANKNDFDSSDTLSNEYIIETVGSLFEKVDNKLRRKLSLLLTDFLCEKHKLITDNSSTSQVTIAQISDDLRKLQSWFIEDDKITLQPLKTTQGQ